MLSLDSPRIYLLLGSSGRGRVRRRGPALAGQRALLTGEQIGWTKPDPPRRHVVGGLLVGIGWGISDACPGPVAAQLGAGRVLALAVAAGILVGYSRVSPVRSSWRSSEATRRSQPCRQPTFYEHSNWVERGGT